MGPDPERDATGPEGGDESVGSLVRRRLGDEVYEVLVGPLLSGVNAGNADELSVAAGAPQFAAAMRDHGSLIAGARAQRAAAAANADAPVFYGLDGGMGTLIDALAAEITALGGTVERGTAIEAVRPAGSGDGRLEVTTTTGTSDLRAVDARRADDPAPGHGPPAGTDAAGRRPRHGRGRVRVRGDGDPGRGQGPDRPPARRQRLPRPPPRGDCCSPPARGRRPSGRTSTGPTSPCCARRPGATETSGPSTSTTTRWSTRCSTTSAAPWGCAAARPLSASAAGRARSRSSVPATSGASPGGEPP